MSNPKQPRSYGFSKPSALLKSESTQTPMTVRSVKRQEREERLEREERRQAHLFGAQTVHRAVAPVLEDTASQKEYDELQGMLDMFDSGVPDNVIEASAPAPPVAAPRKTRRRTPRNYEDMNPLERIRTLLTNSIQKQPRTNSKEDSLLFPLETNITERITGPMAHVYSEALRRTHEMNPGAVPLDLDVLSPPRDYMPVITGIRRLAAAMPFPHQTNGDLQLLDEQEHNYHDYIIHGAPVEPAYFNKIATIPDSFAFPIAYEAFQDAIQRGDIELSRLQFFQFLSKFIAREPSISFMLGVAFSDAQRVFYEQAIAKGQDLYDDVTGDKKSMVEFHRSTLQVYETQRSDKRIIISYVSMIEHLHLDLRNLQRENKAMSDKHYLLVQDKDIVHLEQIQKFKGKYGEFVDLHIIHALKSNQRSLEVEQRTKQPSVLLDVMKYTKERQEEIIPNNDIVIPDKYEQYVVYSVRMLGKLISEMKLNRNIQFKITQAYLTKSSQAGIQYTNQTASYGGMYDKMAGTMYMSFLMNSKLQRIGEEYGVHKVDIGNVMHIMQQQYTNIPGFLLDMLPLICTLTAPPSSTQLDKYIDQVEVNQETTKPFWQKQHFHRYKMLLTQWSCFSTLTNVMMNQYRLYLMGRVIYYRENTAELRALQCKKKDKQQDTEEFGADGTELEKVRIANMIAVPTVESSLVHRMKKEEPFEPSQRPSSMTRSHMSGQGMLDSDTEDEEEDTSLYQQEERNENEVQMYQEPLVSQDSITQNILRVKTQQLDDSDSAVSHVSLALTPTLPLLKTDMADESSDYLDPNSVDWLSLENAQIQEDTNYETDDEEFQVSVQEEQYGGQETDQEKFVTSTDDEAKFLNNRIATIELQKLLLMLTSQVSIVSEHIPVCKEYQPILTSKTNTLTMDIMRLQPYLRQHHEIFCSKMQTVVVGIERMVKDNMLDPSIPFLMLKMSQMHNVMSRILDAKTIVDVYRDLTTAVLFSYLPEQMVTSTITSNIEITDFDDMHVSSVGQPSLFMNSVPAVPYLTSSMSLKKPTSEYLNILLPAILPPDLKPVQDILMSLLLVDKQQCSQKYTPNVHALIQFCTILMKLLQHRMNEDRSCLESAEEWVVVGIMLPFLQLHQALPQHALIQYFFPYLMNTIRPKCLQWTASRDTVLCTTGRNQYWSFRAVADILTHTNIGACESIFEHYTSNEETALKLADTFCTHCYVLDPQGIVKGGISIFCPLYTHIAVKNPGDTRLRPTELSNEALESYPLPYTRRRCASHIHPHCLPMMNPQASESMIVSKALGLLPAVNIIYILTLGNNNTDQNAKSSISKLFETCCYSLALYKTLCIESWIDGKMLHNAKFDTDALATTPTSNRPTYRQVSTERRMKPSKEADTVLLKVLQTMQNAEKPVTIEQEIVVLANVQKEIVPADLQQYCTLIQFESFLTPLYAAAEKEDADTRAEAMWRGVIAYATDLCTAANRIDMVSNVIADLACLPELLFRALDLLRRDTTTTQYSNFTTTEITELNKALGLPSTNVSLVMPVALPVLTSTMNSIQLRDDDISVAMYLCDSVKIAPDTKKAIYVFQLHVKKGQNVDSTQCNWVHSLPQVVSNYLIQLLSLQYFPAEVQQSQLSPLLNLMTQLGRSIFKDKWVFPLQYPSIDTSSNACKEDTNACILDIPESPLDMILETQQWNSEVFLTAQYLFDQDSRLKLYEHPPPMLQAIPAHILQAQPSSLSTRITQVMEKSQGDYLLDSLSVYRMCASNFLQTGTHYTDMSNVQTVPPNPNDLYYYTNNALYMRTIFTTLALVHGAMEIPTELDKVPKKWWELSMQKRINSEIVLYDFHGLSGMLGIQNRKDRVQASVHSKIVQDQRINLALRSKLLVNYHRDPSYSLASVMNPVETVEYEYSQVAHNHPLSAILSPEEIDWNVLEQSRKNRQNILPVDLHSAYFPHMDVDTYTGEKAEAQRFARYTKVVSSVSSPSMLQMVQEHVEFHLQRFTEMLQTQFEDTAQNTSDVTMLLDTQKVKLAPTEDNTEKFMKNRICVMLQDLWYNSKDVTIPSAGIAGKQYILREIIDIVCSQDAEHAKFIFQQNMNQKYILKTGLQKHIISAKEAQVYCTLAQEVNILHTKYHFSLLVQAVQKKASDVAAVLYTVAEQIADKYAISLVDAIEQVVMSIPVSHWSAIYTRKTDISVFVSTLSHTHRSLVLTYIQNTQRFHAGSELTTEEEYLNKMYSLVPLYIAKCTDVGNTLDKHLLLPQQQVSKIYSSVKDDIFFQGISLQVIKQYAFKVALALLHFSVYEDLQVYWRKQGKSQTLSNNDDPVQVLGSPLYMLDQCTNLGTSVISSLVQVHTTPVFQEEDTLLQSVPCTDMQLDPNICDTTYMQDGTVHLAIDQNNLLMKPEEEVQLRAKEYVYRKPEDQALVTTCTECHCLAHFIKPFLTTGYTSKYLQTAYVAESPDKDYLICPINYTVQSHLLLRPTQMLSFIPSVDLLSAQDGHFQHTLASLGNLPIRAQSTQPPKQSNATILYNMQTTLLHRMFTPSVHTDTFTFLLKKLTFVDIPMLALCLHGSKQKPLKLDIALSSQQVLHSCVTASPYLQEMFQGFYIHNPTVITADFPPANQQAQGIPFASSLEQLDFFVKQSYQDVDAAAVVCVDKEAQWNPLYGYFTFLKLPTQYVAVFTNYLKYASQNKRTVLQIVQFLVIADNLDATYGLYVAIMIQHEESFHQKIRLYAQEELRTVLKQVYAIITQDVPSLLQQCAHQQAIDLIKVMVITAMNVNHHQVVPSHQYIRTRAKKDLSKNNIPLNTVIHHHRARRAPIKWSQPRTTSLPAPHTLKRTLEDDMAEDSIHSQEIMSQAQMTSRGKYTPSAADLQKVRLNEYLDRIIAQIIAKDDTMYTLDNIDEMKSLLVLLPPHVIEDLVKVDTDNILQQITLAAENARR